MLCYIVLIASHQLCILHRNNQSHSVGVLVLMCLTAKRHAAYKTCDDEDDGTHVQLMMCHELQLL